MPVAVQTVLNSGARHPVISNEYERQFVYLCGAVSPFGGQLDWKLSREMKEMKEMNTMRIDEFLTRIGGVTRRISSCSDRRTRPDRPGKRPTAGAQ